MFTVALIALVALAFGQKLLFATLAVTIAAVQYDLTPFIAALAPYAAAVLAAFVGWVLLKLQKALHVTIEANQRQALLGAVEAGIAWALKTLPKTATVDQRVAAVADYVAPKVPGALKALTGGDPDHLREIIEARLPA